jgi:NAD(P)-dependent dehydrogenase (short-subunit alcohol dehydrogenase family)
VLETRHHFVRLATPDEVAAGIAYLASPGAAMVTGHSLMMDGGWTPM